MRRGVVVGTVALTVLLVLGVVFALRDTGDSAPPPPLGAPPTEATVQREDSPEFVAATATCPPRPTTTFPPKIAPAGSQVSLEAVPSPEQTTVMAFHPGGWAYIGTRDGTVWLLTDGELSAEPVIDLTADTSTKDDQGLLGLAVDPEGAHLYVQHTDAGGTSAVLAYPLDERIPVVEDAIDFIQVSQPTRQHNGGDLAFGPDGYLYLGFGDGGGLGDPFGYAQDPATVLGAILRVDVDLSNEPPYRAAPGNPFDGSNGSELVWLYGVRNPFRFTFDRITGDMWLPDLGQQCVEEINVFPASSGAGGSNLGWNILEGSLPFLGDSLAGSHVAEFEYRHEGGFCAIVGGHVYRGRELPGLVGMFVFADLCDGRILAYDPATRRVVTGSPMLVSRPVSFAQNNEGELYIVSLEEGVFRLVAA